MSTVNPYIPATPLDEAHLKNQRARVWPQVWFCVILVAAIIAFCWVQFGWLPPVIGCVAIALVGIVVLLGYGMAPFASREVNRSISIARQKTSTRISPR